MKHLITPELIFMNAAKTMQSLVPDFSVLFLHTTPRCIP